jgi:hypothetical protein
MAAKKTNISGMSKTSAKIIADADEKENVVIKNSLGDKWIGISVSDSDEYKELGFSENHQKDITIELTRYLLVNGAHLVYGGDLRKEGYTELFSELSFQYRDKEEHSKTFFTNYFGWPIYNLLKNADEATYKRSRVEIIKCNPPKEVAKKMENKFVEADTIKNRELWALSMSSMRKEMTKNTAARIFIGGMLSKYKGFYPGIVEEGALCLEAKKPLYLIGAFGGATDLLIRAIKGENEKILVKEVFEWFPELQEFYNTIDEKTLTNNLNEIFKKFRKLGINGLCKLNGLTKIENEALFSTTHFHEMIYIILLGLKKTLKNSK